jgi:hypothetical protein
VLLLGLVITEAAAAAAREPASRNAAATTRPLHVLSETAVYCPATGQVTFTIEFDRRSQFRKEDRLGRRADSFQYFLVGDTAQPYPQNFDAIVRGEELDIRGSRGHLPIRNAAPEDPDPQARGWGSVRAVVPLTLRGRVLTFSAPLAALSNRSTDGRVAYSLETYSNFGELVDLVENDSVVSTRGC